MNGFKITVVIFLAALLIGVSFYKVSQDYSEDLQIEETPVGAGFGSFGDSFIVWFLNGSDVPELLVSITDGCAEWASNALTTTGSACGAGGAGADFAWTVTDYGVATTTIVGFEGGFLSAASSTISNLIALEATTTNATTTGAALFGGAVDIQTPAILRLSGGANASVEFYSDDTFGTFQADCR